MLSKIEAYIADKVLSHSLQLFRLTAGERKKAIVILRNMQKELIGSLASTDINKRNQAKAYLKESASIIDDYYDSLSLGLNDTLTELSTHVVDKTAAIFDGVGLAVVMPTTEHMKSIVSDMLIQGAPQKEWWSKQSADTTFKFSAQVRQGIAQGETTQEIVKRIKNIVSVSEANASALVHTSVQTVANESRSQFFKENADGEMQLSTFDTHTSNVCIAYSGASYDSEDRPINGTTLPKGSIPRHFNCRSTWVPIIDSTKDLPPGLRFSDIGFIKANTTFDEYLKMKPKSVQDEMLGKGKAELWRTGKITLSDLVNQNGRPLTLDKLKQL
jgi:SPP1 gp7 family putative phage head morphogenesis protein